MDLLLLLLMIHPRDRPGIFCFPSLDDHTDTNSVSFGCWYGNHGRETEA